MPLALAAAITVHLLLLLGIGFELPEPAPPPVRTLEVMTVEQPARIAGEPLPGSVRAQVDRAGETRMPLPELDAGSAEDAPPQQSPGAAAPALSEQPPREVSETPPAAQPSAADAAPQTGPETAGAESPPATARTRRLLDTSPAAMAGIVTGLGAEVPLPELSSPAPAPASAPDASAIFASQGDEIAAINARIDARNARAAGRQRRKAISTSTREYRYASYMEAWRRKVERIGNLNYPQEAKEKALFGSLILHVAVRADGSLEGVRVVRSSGHAVLDQAAVRIVQLAAPFAPFPADIKAETDVLDITRVWQFQRNHQLGWKD
ncbi:energy transducer TonB [uncultured Thiohalocapsa sp.]|uniref:energy transducer TonB n=1 Tax=uncultured Thiohalocapsa sp. TaxID=768990 RepID=UPI0025CCA572|nr:energy transducer TonB [uncultured Thiohalocapsa sp.]